MLLQMAAAASRNTKKQLREELSAVFAAFERSTGLYVCFRPMSERWFGSDGSYPAEWLYGLHRSPFCVAVKARSETACARCDYSELPAACSSPEGRIVEPLVRTCHAGADEVLLPIWSHGVLVAVL